MSAIPSFDHVMEPTYKIRMQARTYALSLSMHDSVRHAWDDASYADSFPHSYTASAVETSRALIWAMSSGKLTEHVLDLVDHINMLHQSRLWYKFDR